VVTGTSGERLGGRYALLDPIGRGGMAVVWRARDLVLDRDVAVKVLSLDLAFDAASRERIRAEAQAVARLQHPNITNVHDYGEAAGDGSPYVVMELLEGQLLSQRLRRGPMSWQRATYIGAQVAAALAAAHDRGVVHRDIKPTNIMLTTSGAKVLDFGVAGLAGSPDDDDSGMVFGTPAYLAPERLLGDVVVPATDVYALGLLVYRCLTDRLPWAAETPTQMIANHVYEPPNPLPAIPGLPAEVATLVGRCLAKEPDDRPSAKEAARILAAAAGIQVVLPGIDAGTTNEVSSVKVERALRPPQPRRRARHHASRPRRSRLAAAAALVLAGAAAIAVTWAVSRPNADASTNGCRVNFYLRPAPNVTFDARVTVVNTGTVTLKPWTVDVVFPGTDHVESATNAEFSQTGNKLHLYDAHGAALPPGKAITLALSGTPGSAPRGVSGASANGIACRLRFIGDGTLPPMTGITNPPADLDAPHSAFPGGPPPGPPPSWDPSHPPPPANGSWPPPPPPGYAPSANGAA
jgi:eukaryotic-like serine/threonine-protein kinase